jgi:phosphatidate cytidylyltransferase
MKPPDQSGLHLSLGIGGLLVVASAVGIVLKYSTRDERAQRTIANLNARIRAWWIMAGIFGAAIYFGKLGATILFALVSFLALREMITLSPTRRGDHRALFWCFFVISPLQYWIVYVEWYGMMAIFIPVYCFLFIAIRSTLAGDTTRYLERVAKIMFSLMICVYFLSHLPSIMILNVDAIGRSSWKLLAFLVIVVQMSDVLQYVWGKLFGRHKIAPHVSPSKTWEGFIGGVLSASILAVGLRWLTPFGAAQAFGIGLLSCLMGFAGGIVMSAIKRDAGVKDYGHLIEGHGGVMDRFDSLSFAAPIFFHVVGYYFNRPMM